MPWKKSTRTEIVHIVVTGYQKKKEPSKYYVFVIDVTWNNSERFEVYRRYSDFFSFQTTLKALFPGAAGRKPSEERIIPQLPKRIFVGRSHVARVAEARVEQINRYCQTLISLDPKVSESAHVVGFFSPRIGDRQLPKLHLHRPASLHPEKVPSGNMFEEYCALAEYVAEDKSQVSFRSGDKVLVMSKDESGWWMCGVDGKVGWAPPSYLKKCEDKMNESDESDEDDLTCQKGKDSDDSGVGENSASEPSTPASSIDSIKNFVAPEIKVEAYRAIDSYQADGPGQVSFDTGETIHVLDKLEDGWWFVSNGREEGWAPCSYLEGDKEEEIMTNLEDVEKYYSVDDYQAEEEDEISFKRGVVVDVLQKSLDGWWVVKLDKVFGLAPATFLKKVENREMDPTGSVVRKVSPPTSSLSPFLTFQQPPRKQSVRARAGMRNKPAAVGGQLANKYSSSQPGLPSIPADRPYTSPVHASRQPESIPDIPVRSLRSLGREKSLDQERSPGNKRSPGKERPPQRERPPAKEPLPTPRISIPSSKEQSVSPDISDSDPEENYLNYSFQQFAIDQPVKKRIPSSSESSITSSPSEEGGSVVCASKPPVATPRRHKSPHPRSQSESEFAAHPPLPSRERPRPPLPPRPKDIPKIKKYKSLDEPQRPKQRPRKSEIKRAKNRARQAKNAPSLTVVDEDGFESMSTVSSRSSKSSNSYTSCKSTPVISSNEVPLKRRTNTNDPEMSHFLVPSNSEHRQRRRSANDDAYNGPTPPVPTSPRGSVDNGGGENSLQVADTLLKLIMSSDDPGIKAKLRDLLAQDSKIADALYGDQ